MKEAQFVHKFTAYTSSSNAEASALEHFREHILKNGWQSTEYRLKHFDLDADLDWDNDNESDLPLIFDFFKMSADKFYEKFGKVDYNCLLEQASLLFDFYSGKNEEVGDQTTAVHRLAKELELKAGPERPARPAELPYCAFEEACSVAQARQTEASLSQGRITSSKSPEKSKNNLSGHKRNADRLPVPQQQ